ncbi:MAG: hydrogenase HupD, partial [Aquificaceae bacterium]
MIFGDENSPIAVLGVGNILLSDEGFGVRVVQHLVKWYDFTPQIRV